MFLHQILCNSTMGRGLPVKQALKVISMVAVLGSPGVSYSADLATLQNLPLFQIGNLKFAGGFKVPQETLGESEASYAEGPITLGANGTSMYMVGHAYQQAIAEISIPEIVNTTSVSALRRASAIQNFSRVLSRPASGNVDNLDRIGGMEYVNGMLLVNAYVYYDANAGADTTTMAIQNANNLSGSAVAGYHRFAARAHAAGWISPIPAEWQQALGGTHISGYSSGGPIISRWSVGPSAFAFTPTNPNLANASPTTIPATTLMDFSLQNPMGMDAGSAESYLNNSDRNNKMWNHITSAKYGFVVPGTRTYMAVGFSGGYDSGVGYKITQDNGNVCGGYCAYSASDYSNYYWLFDLNDLLAVKNGSMNSYDIKPYAFGKFESAFANGGFSPILGGAVDINRGLLYLNLEAVEPFEWGGGYPGVAVYSLGTQSPPKSPADTNAQVLE